MHLQQSKSWNLLSQYFAHNSNTAEKVAESFLEGWSDIYKFFLTFGILVKAKYFCSKFILVQKQNLYTVAGSAGQCSITRK
jgi:hypothetical protein